MVIIPPFERTFGFHRASSPDDQVSTYQMCILLMFNQRSSWSYQEIADETEIPERDLMRAMQSLTMGKIGQRVLARIGEGSKVGLRGVKAGVAIKHIWQTPPLK